MNDRTPDALASALPGGIDYYPGGDGQVWNARAIAAFQAKKLAESGYVLVYTAVPDEATVERLAEALYEAQDLSPRWKYKRYSEFDPGQLEFWRHKARAALAALADTGAQALGPDPAQARMDSIAADRAQARHTADEGGGQT